MEINIDNEKLPCSPYIMATNFSPLMKAILKHDLNSIKENLQDINAVNSIGWTALMIASRNSNIWSSNDIVELLLNNGADPNFKNENGWTALMSVSGYSREESSEKTVEILLEKGADHNIKYKKGWTA